MMPPLQYVLLCLQDGLANFIIPQLRAVIVDVDTVKREILPSFFFDCELTEELIAECWITTDEVNTNTSEHYTTDHEILQLSYPKPIPIRGKLYSARSDLVNLSPQILRPSSIAELEANLESLQERAMCWDGKDALGNSSNLTARSITYSLFKTGGFQ